MPSCGNGIAANRIRTDVKPSQSLRILHLDDGRGWRGGQQQVSFLLRQQVLAGHRPVLVCPPDVPLASWAGEQGLEVHVTPLRGEFHPRAVAGVRRAIQSTAPDVVHAHTSHAHTIALLATRGEHRPLRVVSRRLTKIPGRSPVAQWKYGPAVDLFVAVSHAVRRDLVTGGVDPDRVLVAASAIDPERFASPPPRQEALAAFGLPPEARLVGTLGSLVRQKSQEDLVAAFALLAPGRPDLHLVILGEGELRGALEGQVRSLGLVDRVHLPGFRQDAGDLLPHWDLAALPSLYEGMPNAILDALAALVPVVATPAGGAAEVLLPGAGRVVPFRAPARLACAMDWMLSHPAEARDMARLGRSRVLAGFVPPVMAAAIEDGYRQGLAARAGEAVPGPGRAQHGSDEVWGRDGMVRQDLLDRAASTTGLPVPGGPAGPGPTGRAAILRAEVAGVPAVLKVHRRGGLPARICGLLPGDGAGLFPGPQRAVRMVDVSRALAARGGRTPEALGWLSRRRGPWVRLYSAAAEIAGAATLDQALQGSTGGKRTQLLVSLGRALARWHHAGLIHRDLNAGNILVVDGKAGDSTGQKMWVIDLESARLCRSPSRSRRATALARLERSLLKILGAEAPGPRERLRVLGAYAMEWSLLEGRPPRRAAGMARGLLGPLGRRRLLYPLHGVRI
jgi:glycosyltransferase involved in cell wall biosynthesis